MVTSSSTANARAQLLISNQETQVLTRELPGVSLEQPAQPWVSGVGQPGLGVCFCGARVEATAPLPSIPKFHCHLEIWGKLSFDVKTGGLPLCYSVMLPSCHLHCLLLLPPSMGALAWETRLRWQANEQVWVRRTCANCSEIDPCPSQVAGPGS